MIKDKYNKPKLSWNTIRIKANILKNTPRLQYLCQQIIKMSADYCYELRASGEYKINRYENYANDMLDGVDFFESVMERFFEEYIPVNRKDDITKLVDFIEKRIGLYEDYYTDKEGFGVGTVVEMKNILKELIVKI